MKSRRRWLGPAGAAAVLAGLPVVLSWSARLFPGHVSEPASATRWISSASVAGVSRLGGETFLAARGALLALGPDGRVSERLWDPEAEWRAVDGAAAAGIRHWAVRRAGKWVVRSLPGGVEGYAVAMDPGGTWVGHSAGATHFGADGEVRRSYPSFGPVRLLVPEEHRVWILGSRKWSLVDAVSGKEEWLEPPAELAPPWTACAWKGELVVAGGGPDGRTCVLLRSGGGWRKLPSPDPEALGAAALAADGHTLYLALPGKGLRQWDGRSWTTVVTPPDLAPAVSSLCAHGSELLVGTWTHGAWLRRGGQWRRLAVEDELPVGNVQALAAWGGRLWLSSFDRGLWSAAPGAGGEVRGRWGREEGLSSETPRALAPLPDRLLVRHGGGEIDSNDGRRWTRDVLKWKVPRAWSASLSTEGAVGGWGGVSHLESAGWQQRILPEPLRAETVTCASGSAGPLIVGTARRGLWQVSEGAVAPVPGIADPWVTALDSTGDALLVGTFSGEAAYWPHVSGHPETGRRIAVKLASPVTAVCLEGGRPPVVACRSGLWRIAGGEWRPVSSSVLNGLEPQCLYAGRTGLWVGGRTGVAFLPWKDLELPDPGTAARG